MLAGLALSSAAVGFLRRHRRKKGENVPAKQGSPRARPYLVENKVPEQPQELGSEDLPLTLKRNQEYLLPQELPAGSPHHEGLRLGSR